MREIERDKAEAKFSLQIRQTKLEFEQVETRMKMQVREADDRLKKQEIEARQGQKDLSAGHKRNLEDMREEIEIRRDKEMKERDESYRQVRLKRREMVRDLDKTNTDLLEARADKDELVKAVTRGRVRVEGMRQHGLAWQGKHNELQDKMIDREEWLTFLEGSVVDHTRQVAVLQKKHDDLARIVVQSNGVSLASLVTDSM